MGIYEGYYQSFKNIVQDIEILKNIALGKLWNEGLNVLKGSIIEKDKCPLCYQPKSKKDLTQEIESRLTKLDSIRKQKSQFDDTKKSVQKALDEIRNITIVIQSNKCFNLEDNKTIKDFVKYIEEYISLITQELGIDILKGEKIKAEIKFNDTKLNETIISCQKRNELLASQIKGRKILEVQDKITLSRQLYIDIKKLKKEKEILEKQKKSIEIIYSAFIQNKKMNWKGL